MRKRAGLLFITTFIFMVMLQVAKAQTPVTAQGIVKDEKGAALAGATIAEKDHSNNITTSDNNGHFVLVLRGKSRTLTISYVGFDDKTVAVAPGTTDVQLRPAKSNTSEVVVIGYQNQKRRNVTAAVSSISGKEIQNIPEASFDQLLQGRLAGVAVQSSTGAPGSKPNIVIRGSTNVDYGNGNGGNTAPLYVIDGVIFDVNNMLSSTGTGNPLTLINPNDIESIDVLKDASASAIYGARGGNGVIIVKTKRARRNARPQVDVSGYLGVTSRPNLRKVVTGVLERQLKLNLLHEQLPYADFANGGNVPQALTDSLNPAFNNNIDWQGLIMRDFALVNNQDIAMAGFFAGNNSYRISLNHYSEQGAVKGFSLERLAPNLNLTLNPIPKIGINTNLIMSFEKRRHGASIDEFNPYIFSNSNFPSSFTQLDQQTRDIYNGTSEKYDDNRIFSLNANVQVTDTVTKDLTLTTSFGMNDFADKYAFFSPKEINGIQNTAYDYEHSNPNWNWESYLQYFKSLGEHHLVLVGGYSAYKAQRYELGSYASGINVSGIYTLQTVPTGSNLSVSTAKEIKTTQSYFGRLSYDYKGRYLLTGALRRDASSIYSPQYRWGTFGSVSAGWIASDEKFFEPLKKIINFFKVRASYGVTGQDPGGWYSKYQQLYADASFYGATTGAIGGNTYYSYLSGTPSTYNGTTVISPFGYNNNFVTYAVKSSSTVRWETYPQVDIGTEFNLFNDRIGVVVDWYQKDAKDKFLWAVPAIQNSGYQYYSGNLANVRNTGLEIALNTHNMGTKSAIQWNTGFNISFNKNWITKLPNENRDLLFGDPWFRKTLSLGSPLFSYKLYQADGVYGTDADVPVDPITGKKLTYFGTPLSGGDSRVKDQNGDYNIDYEDQIPDGSSPLPKFNGGITNTFSYKGLTLTVFASFSYGNKILNGSLSDNLNGSAGYSSWGSNAGPAAFGSLLNQFWQKPEDETRYPRLVYSVSSNPYATDPWNISRSYFLEPGGYIKVKQIMLAYAIPAGFTKRVGIRSLQVYGMGENLFMLKQSKNIADPELYDPTTGSVNIIYPTALKFTLGVQMGL